MGVGETNDRTAQADAALAYLRSELRERAPAALEFAGEFGPAALAGEGRTALFRFELAPHAPDAACSADPAHYVAVGETEPNFFPAYGLDADQAYSFHLGTRFMLVMSVRKRDDAEEPPGARPALRRFVEQYARDARIEEEALAAVFQCDQADFYVHRLRVDGQPYYCMGGDCPPGFYALTDYPPQVPLRLHLGQAIRAESDAPAGGA